MYQSFFADMETALPLLGFGLFVLAFGLVLLRTFGLQKKSDYDRVAALPLNDGTSHDAEVKP